MMGLVRIGIATVMGGPAGGVLSAIWSFLKGVPRWAWIALGVALVLWRAWAWHQRAVRAAHDLGASEVTDARDAAQAAADRQARANQAAKGQAHAANNQETTDANATAHSAADGVAGALRLRIADLERQARARAVPRAGGAAGEADAAGDLRLSLTDELALRQACEAERIDRTSLIEWERRRLVIEQAPPPADPQ